MKDDGAMKEGISLLKEGRQLEALAHFERVQEQCEKSPVWQSYWGLLNGLERGQLKEGRRLCKSAVEKLPQRTDLYLNLSQVQAKSELKGDALSTLRAGLLVEPDNGDLVQALDHLGIRRPPVFSFLSRSHRLNRLLGKVRHAFWGFFGKNPRLLKEGVDAQSTS